MVKEACCKGLLLQKLCKESEKGMYFRENYAEKQENSYRKYSGNTALISLLRH